jgi:hypothetical protein
MLKIARREAAPARHFQRTPPPLTLSLRGSAQFRRRQSLSSLLPGRGCCGQGEPAFGLSPVLPPPVPSSFLLGRGCCGQDVPPKHCVLLCGGGSSCLQQAGWANPGQPIGLSPVLLAACSLGRAPPASSVRPGTPPPLTLKPSGLSPVPPPPVPKLSPAGRGAAGRANQPSGSAQFFRRQSPKRSPTGVGLLRAGCPTEALRSFVRRWELLPAAGGVSEPASGLSPHCWRPAHWAEPLRLRVYDPAPHRP